MPFTPIANGCRVVDSWDFNGKPAAEVVWGVQLTGTLDSTTADDINDAFTAFYTTLVGGISIKILQSSDWSHTGREITDVRTETAPQLTYPGYGAGTATADPLPPGIAIKTALYGGLRGRAYRGAKYLPGIAENNSNANGALDPSLVTFMDNKYAVLISTLNASGVPLAILSRSDGEAHQVFTTQTSATFHYQRRRQRAG